MKNVLQLLERNHRTVCSLQSIVSGLHDCSVGKRVLNLCMCVCLSVCMYVHLIQYDISIYCNCQFDRLKSPHVCAETVYDILCVYVCVCACVIVHGHCYAMMCVCLLLSVLFETTV